MDIKQIARRLSVGNSSTAAVAEQRAITGQRMRFRWEAMSRREKKQLNKSKGAAVAVDTPNTRRLHGAIALLEDEQAEILAAFNH